MGGVAAIVPAAGQGRRFGGRTPKAFARLNGRPLIVHTLAALQRSPAVRWIVLVVDPAQRPLTQRLIERYGITKALLAPGGSSRAESVARGAAMAPRQARWILVHDGARPCLTGQLIRRAVQAAHRYGAVACGLPASLTVKRASVSGDVRSTLDRDRLWLVQTPQVFRRDLFAKALERANHGVARFPDDASIVEAAGYRVRLILGDPLNIKVTTRDDLILAEAVLRSRAQRSEIRNQKSDKHGASPF